MQPADKSENFPCHPERLKKIKDFHKESKDLRTDPTANVIFVRRFFDALRLLRMTDLGLVLFWRLHIGVIYGIIYGNYPLKGCRL